MERHVGEVNMSSQPLRYDVETMFGEQEGDVLGSITFSKKMCSEHRFSSNAYGSHHGIGKR